MTCNDGNNSYRCPEPKEAINEFDQMVAHRR